MPKVFRYSFSQGVSLDQVEESLNLCAIATEILHGEAQTRLEVRHVLDRDSRRCIVDGTLPAGRDFNKLFAGLLLKEFGDAFQVKRVDAIGPSVPTAAA